MTRSLHSVDATTAAKHLGIGRNKLLALLRKNGFTHTHGTGKNLPRKKWREAGLFTTELVQFQRGPVFVLHEKLKITADGLMLCRELIDQTETATNE